MLSESLGLHLVKILYIAVAGNAYLLSGALTSDAIRRNVAKDYDPSLSASSSIFYFAASASSAA